MLRYGLAVLYLLVLVLPLHAEGTGPNSWWFQSLKAPSGMSCCSVADCHATEARADDQGNWQALVPRNVRDNTPIWIDGPAIAVLASPRSIDGRAYICLSPNSDNEHSPVVYCFVPPWSIF
jgi:hypothetical protein